jgi:hypothetical protein
MSPVALVANAGADAFFRWKEFLKNSLGWTVQMSGDGVALFSAVGDIITSGANGAGGVNNRAWVRMQDPDGVAEIINQITSGVDAGTPAQVITSQCKYSPLARFVLGPDGQPVGNIDFETVPSASDEWMFRGAGTDSAPFGRSSFGNTTQNSIAANNENPHLIAMGETTFPFRFWVAKMFRRTPPDATFGHVRVDGWLYDLCQGAQNPLLADTNQMFITMGANQSGGNVTLGTYSAAWLNSNTNDSTSESQGSARFATSGPFQITRVSGPLNQNAVAVSPWLATARDLVPVVVNHRDGEPGTSGIKGVLSWVRGVMQAAVVDQMGTSFTVDGQEYAYLLMNGTALPWNGVQPDAAWTTQLPGILWNQVTDIDLPGGKGVLTYRMRGVDGGAFVYWSAPRVDLAGDFYTGPGPLSSVIVSNIVTKQMI